MAGWPRRSSNPTAQPSIPARRSTASAAGGLGTKGYCAYYPWLGTGPGLRPPFSGKVEHDGYHCYEVRAESGYFVLFQPDGVYAGTLVPVPG